MDECETNHLATTKTKSEESSSYSKHSNSLPTNQSSYQPQLHCERETPQEIRITTDEEISRSKSTENLIPELRNTAKPKLKVKLTDTFSTAIDVECNRESGSDSGTARARSTPRSDSLKLSPEPEFLRATTTITNIVSNNNRSTNSPSGNTCVDTFGTNNAGVGSVGNSCRRLLPSPLLSAHSSNVTQCLIENPTNSRLKRNSYTKKSISLKDKRSQGIQVDLDLELELIPENPTETDIKDKVFAEVVVERNFNSGVGIGLINANIESKSVNSNPTLSTVAEKRDKGETEDNVEVDVKGVKFGKRKDAQYEKDYFVEITEKEKEQKGDGDKEEGALVQGVLVSQANQSLANQDTVTNITENMSSSAISKDPESNPNWIERRMEDFTHHHYSHRTTTPHFGRSNHNTPIETSHNSATHVHLVEDSKNLQQSPVVTKANIQSELKNAIIADSCLLPKSPKFPVKLQVRETIALPELKLPFVEENLNKNLGRITDNMKVKLDAQPKPSPMITRDGNLITKIALTKFNNEETFNNQYKSPPDLSMSAEPDLGDYDSDCLVIVETSNDYTNEPIDKTHVTSTSSQSPQGINTTDKIVGNLNNEEIEVEPPGGRSNLHNLPINELKRKLAFCAVCQTQHSNHKQANICLSKHGKRQCWLCLEVMANTKDSYFQHCLDNHAVGASNDIVGCPYCQKFFDFRQGFNQHIVKVHFSEDTSYVSTTASLSPRSLVDIYTGQFRYKQNERQRESYLNEIRITSTTSLVENPTTPIPTLNHNTNIESYPTSITPGDSCTFINSVPPVRLNDQRYKKSKSHVNYNFIPSLNDKVRNINRMEFEGGSPELRETVIRETPQSNLTFSKLPRIPASCFGYPPLPYYEESEFGGSVGGTKSQILGHKQTSHSGSAFSTSGCSSENSRLTSHAGDVALGGIPFNNNSQRQLTEQSSMIHPRSKTPFGHPSCSLPMQNKYRNQFSPYPNEYGCTNHDQGYSTNITPSPGPGARWDYSDNGSNSNHIPQLSPQKEQVDLSLPNSTSLLQMERLVQSTPVHTQYFNSVNTMLRTVAELSVQNTNRFTPRNSCDLDTSTFQMERLSPPLSSPKEYSNPKHSPSCGRRPSDSSDSEMFKTPNKAGVKRRILTKWDEHKGTTKGRVPSKFPHNNPRIVPSLTTTAMELNELDQEEVEILTDYNPTQRQSEKILVNPNKGKTFWEQVLNDSNAMYKTVNEHMVQIHGETTIQGPLNVPSNYTITDMDNQYDVKHYYEPDYKYPANRSNSQHHQYTYPRIMARVDPSGRPIGIFTKDSPTCLLSSSSQLCQNQGSQKQCHLTGESGQMDYVTDASTNHLQYQHRIIRQVVPSNSPNYRSSHYVSNRKRKSSTPTRVVPNPNYDNVVVQNPFEEEESSTAKKIFSIHNPYHIPHSQTPIIHRPTSPQKYNQQADKLKNYQIRQRLKPKFTSGGLITDFSHSRSRNSPGSPSNTVRSNVSNSYESYSIATNLGAWNVDHCAGVSVDLQGGIGVGSAHANISQHQHGPTGFYCRNEPTPRLGSGNSRKIRNSSYNTIGVSDGSNPDGRWPPFNACQRYFETTHNIVNRLKNMDKQRKDRLEVATVSK